MEMRWQCQPTIARNAPFLWGYDWNGIVSKLEYVYIYTHLECICIGWWIYYFILECYCIGGEMQNKYSYLWGCSCRWTCHGDFVSTMGCFFLFVYIWMVEKLNRHI